MKELTKRILESGLVDKHLALAMERWGNLERGDAETVGTAPVTKETFQRFADDIALLIDADDPIKETILDPLSVTPIRLSTSGKTVDGAVDEMGRIVIQGDLSDSTLRSMVNEQVEAWSEGGKHYFFRFTDFERVYLGDKVAAVRWTMEPPVIPNSWR